MKDKLAVLLANHQSGFSTSECEDTPQVGLGAAEFMGSPCAASGSSSQAATNLSPLQVGFWALAAPALSFVLLAQMLGCLPGHCCFPQAGI